MTSSSSSFDIWCRCVILWSLSFLLCSLTRLLFIMLSPLLISASSCFCSTNDDLPSLLPELETFAFLFSCFSTLFTTRMWYFHNELLYFPFLCPTLSPVSTCSVSLLVPHSRWEMSWGFTSCVSRPCPAFALRSRVGAASSAGSVSHGVLLHLGSAASVLC